MSEQSKQSKWKGRLFDVGFDVRWALTIVFAVMAVISGLCWLWVSSTEEHTDEHVESLVPKIVATHEFDESSFTQGLEIQDADTVVVSTGQRGESRLYKRQLDGTELASADLDDDFFGEGITQYGDSIWQLTWQEHTAIKRSAATLAETTRVQYPGEGWGLWLWSVYAANRPIKDPEILAASVKM